MNMNTTDHTLIKNFEDCSNTVLLTEALSHAKPTVLKQY